MAEEQLVPANALATTRQWLESFVAADYSLQGFHIRKILFCVSCMEGTLNASDFKPGQPHAGHPYLQVRKHGYRGQVVNRDDLSKFIDTVCLQPYQTNSVFTFALRARRDVTLVRAPFRRRRVCACCNDTLTSDSPLVTLCSVECLVRASEQFPLTVKPDAPTVMEPPKRRSYPAEPSSLHVQGLRGGETPGEGERVSKYEEDQELKSATEEEKVADAPTVMEPLKRRHDQAGPSSLHLPNRSPEKTPGEGEGVSRFAAEDRELEPPKRRYDVAGPSSLPLQDRRTGKTPGEGEGAPKSAAEDRELLELASEPEETVAMLLQPDVRARSESEEINGTAASEGGARVMRSALAEKMWNKARKATVAATSEQNPRFNGDDVERVRSVGTYARFMLSILGIPSREERRRPPEGMRDGAANSAPPADIDAAENETSIAAVLDLLHLKRQNAS